MAKIELIIDGNKKIFRKSKLTLGNLRRQAKFEQKIQSIDEGFYELQKLLRDNKELIKKSEDIEEKMSQTEDEEELKALQAELDGLEETEEFKKMESEVNQLRERTSEKQVDTDEMYDDFAELLVNVFDNQFTIDDVFDGLEVESSLVETYNKIFSDGNSTGKPATKKKATTKAKAQAK